MTTSRLAQVVAVIPTYNEATTIDRTITEMVALPCRPDVIVVDDRSPDGTARAVRGTTAYRDGKVTILDGPTKQGIGTAYRSGFGLALRLGYDTIVQIDADGSHPCSAVTSLLDGLRHCDLAVGSRYVPGGSAAGLSPARRALSIAGNRYARALLHLDIRDLTGGFKAWSRSALEAARPQSSVTDGYAFQIEMTLRASRAGALVCEVPIQFQSRRSGASKMSWRIAAEAIRAVPAMARESISVESPDLAAERV